MNLISIKNNFLYSVENRTCTTQLQEDFGNFPPFPLKCKNTDVSFKIVKVRGIGVLYHTTAMFMKTITSASPKTEFESSVQNGFVTNEQKIFIDAANTLSSMVKDKNKLFVYTIVLPMLLIVARKSKFMERTISGWFIPIKGYENHITVKFGTRNRKNRLASTLSHEHIHFLQYKNSKSNPPAIKNTDTLLSDEYKEHTHLLYLLERNETEARLHELVLSFYRVKKELPLTKDGFIELLAGSNQLGWLVASAMESNNIALKDGLTKYCDRDIEFVKQLEYILLFCKNTDILFRFITEVLPVMYGNLLRHYGDEESSLCFMNTVERPNLYDTLYV